MSNEVNHAYSAVSQSDIVATYETKERAIKPVGLRIALIYVNIGRVKLIQRYIICIILNCWNLLRIIHVFLLMDLKIAIKQLLLLSINILSSQNVYLTRRQFLLLN